MALQKQIFRMSAQGGLDTKTDEKNVLPTNFLELENLVFTKTGAFIKRYGYTAFTKNILESVSQVSTGQAATTFKDELLRYTDSKLYSYSPGESKWADKGNTKFALAEEAGIVVNGDKSLMPCHDTINNLTCYVYNRQAVVTSTVEYKILDNVTGTTLAVATVASGSLPTVIALTDKFFIFYVVSGSLKMHTVSAATPNTISSATTVLTTSYYSADLIGSKIYIAAHTASNGVQLTHIDYAGTIRTPVTVIDTVVYDRFAIAAEGSNVRVVYTGLSATAVKTVLYTSDLGSQVHAPVAILASNLAQNLGTIQDPSNSSRSQVFVSITSAPYNLKRYFVTSSGTVSSSSVVFYQASLQSRPQVYGGKVYFVVSRNSSLLPASPYRTYFLASEDGYLMCKYSLDAGVYRNDGGGVPRLNVEGASLTFCGAEAAEIQVSGSSVQVPTIVKKFGANFSQTNNFFDTTLGDNLHIAGGIVKMYDGTSVVEHSFLQIPDKPQLVAQGNGAVGAILPTGSYQYKLVYKWTDKWGQVHRSAPSVALTYVVPSATTSLPTIRVLTLPFTSKANVELEIYRTEANGTVFYKKAASFIDRITNDSSVESLSFDDTTDDATLINGEVLYTTGGVLENESGSSCNYITTYKARAFTILSDGYTLQYSKRREQGGPVEFAEELKVSVDVYGGKAIALAVMDDHLLIFKERAIFALTGEGPNALGEQDDFREPYLINSDVGCVDPGSVVATPEGLMFKSAKGIRILRRNFAEEYVGAGVEGYNDLTITSATLIPDTNEVRFTTDSDRALVYDYYHRFWSTFTNIDAVDALIYDGNYTFLRSNGDLMTESKTVFTDDGTYITTKLTSSWIQLAGIQGYQRLYKLLLLGSYKSRHSLRVQFAYDFSPTWAHEATVDAGETLVDSGDSYPLYQFRFYPKQQKCQAFKFSISDFQTTETGESLSLSNFAVEMGMKQTAVKRGGAKSFGAS